MAKILQIKWVVFKVSLQLIRIQNLSLQLLYPRLLDCAPRDCSQGVLHSVPERFNLLHIKLILLHLASSRRLFLLYSCEYSLIVLCARAIPDRPARAVRPTRWVYARDEEGRSKFKTQDTSMKSTPRVTPYSLSPFRCFRFRDGAGAGEDFFRLFEAGVDDSAVSRWVDVTARVLAIRTSE